MNPYAFVPIDWSKKPRRSAPTGHHKFEGVSGRIEGTITAETPLLIRDPGGLNNRLQFMTNRNRQYIIPGSSLKGMVRNLVETIGNGCFLLYDEDYKDNQWQVSYSDKLPSDFRKCNHKKRLCSTCRMFGTLVEKRQSATREAFHYAGNINLDDAVCINPVKHDPVILPALYKPRPYHEAWYLSPDKQTIAGRKFYFHQPPLYYFKKVNPRRRDPNDTQATPLAPKSQFTFSLTFENLHPEDEFKVLLYALDLQTDNMRHKIGYAKAAGFGTICIDLTKLVKIDYSVRYLKQEGTQTFTGQSLREYLQDQTQSFVDNPSATLSALRNIWKWPPYEPPAGFGYPTRDWFNKNPDAPISKSWDAPRQF